MSDETVPVESNDDSVTDDTSEKDQAEGWVPQEEAADTDGTLADQATPDETPSTEDEARKTVDELAREVLEGMWGSGQERRLALVRAGYDHNEVQARVNQLVAENRA